jgi:hypothetical protein
VVTIGAVGRLFAMLDRSERVWGWIADGSFQPSLLGWLEIPCLAIGGVAGYYVGRALLSLITRRLG